MEEMFDKGSDFSGKTPDELRQMAVEAKERARVAREAAAANCLKISGKETTFSTENSDISARMEAVRKKIEGFKK